MDTNQDVKFIQKTFNKVKELEQQKYRKGLLLHEDMNKQLEANDDFENYRLDFITKSVAKIFTWMEDLSKEFNSSYPDDRFTMNDMRDVLTSAVAVLKKSLDI